MEMSEHYLVVELPNPFTSVLIYMPPCSSLTDFSMCCVSAAYI